MRTEIGLRRDSDVNSVRPDRASPVTKRAKHDQVAAIMADLDRTHGSVAPKHKGSGKKLAKTKATGQKAVQDQDKPGPCHGNEIDFAISPPQGRIPKKRVVYSSQSEGSDDDSEYQWKDVKSSSEASESEESGQTSSDEDFSVQERAKKVFKPAYEMFDPNKAHKASVSKLSASQGHYVSQFFVKHTCSQRTNFETATGP